MSFDPKKLRVNGGISLLSDHYDVKNLMVKVKDKDVKQNKSKRILLK
jgi:hypothetical protein